MIFIILIGFMILGFAVQAQLKRRFKQYQALPIDNGLTGRDIARKMLDDHGLQHVNITAVEGRLTDHYNPKDSSVNLSPDVYHGNHVAAAAIAAHECGHAVQHATKYEWLDLRTAWFPLSMPAAS
jgi:Predicted Zn-dependent protease